MYYKYRITWSTGAITEIVNTMKFSYEIFNDWKQMVILYPVVIERLDW